MVIKKLKKDKYLKTHKVFKKTKKYKLYGGAKKPFGSPSGQNRMMRMASQAARVGAFIAPKTSLRKTLGNENFQHLRTAKQVAKTAGVNISYRDMSKIAAMSVEKPELAQEKVAQLIKQKINISQKKGKFMGNPDAVKDEIQKQLQKTISNSVGMIGSPSLPGKTYIPNIREQTISAPQKFLGAQQTPQGADIKNLIQSMTSYPSMS